MAQPGETIPENITLWTIPVGTEKPEKVLTGSIFSGKKVALFAVPGAFTPGCSKTHCPSFVRNAAALKEKGVDEVICTSVNDVFVMDAWCEHQKATGKITFYADPVGDFAKAVKYEVEMNPAGAVPGLRSRRYAMLVDNGVIKHVGLDESGKIEKSTAEALLQIL
eukprot:TRINITY_DN10722_c0_g1_i1.p1 TRINITY_DN10722_c0_g1~~TRINITY_DN10722_c0_g1_i1.p1  ORF type:complete len:165 (-),score=59.41 TRINITY_DN10722_c0_g1_i1:147-641(-)